jgi:hypothetical protein
MQYQALQDRMRLELARRVESLGIDVAAWTKQERIKAMGIGRRQAAALVTMMTVLRSRQDEAYGRITQPLAPGPFADGYAALLLEMAGANELWRIFRHMLAQFEDAELSQATKLAGRIAADCYVTGIEAAYDLGAIEEEQFREAPLVYLEAVDGPATAGRRDGAKAIGSALRRWRDMKLPLPIVLLPVDYRFVVWSYTAIHHEVGHNLDQDLGLLPGLRSLLPETVPADQEPHWRRWSGEILADAIGVTLGGVGFALSLATIGVLLGPASQYRELDPETVHPPLALRVKLLTEMLRGAAVAEFEPYAAALPGAAGGTPDPDWLAPFTPHAAAVADLFLNRKVAALRDHRVLDLNAKLQADHALAAGLASFFLTGKKRPPPATMPARLVPSAAQIALWQADPLDGDRLREIHGQALEYLLLVPPLTTKLAASLALAQQRDTYYEGLTRAVDFGHQPR